MRDCNMASCLQLDGVESAGEGDRAQPDYDIEDFDQSILSDLELDWTTNVERHSDSSEYLIHTQPLCVIDPNLLLLTNGAFGDFAPKVAAVAAAVAAPESGGYRPYSDKLIISNASKDETCRLQFTDIVTRRLSRYATETCFTRRAVESQEYRDKVRFQEISYKFSKTYF